MVNSGGPQTMAIDPSGSVLYETTLEVNQIRGAPIPGGVWAFRINRSNGSVTTVTGSPYLSDLNLYSDVVDQQGKFLHPQSDLGIYAFSIQSGTGALTQIAGSPFSSPRPFILGIQPGDRMAIDQTNHFRYASTSAGITGFSINQGTGHLKPLPGSPFGRR